MPKEKLPSDPRGQNKILSPKRKRMLMKKLARIKINRSKGNNSFFDISAYYETKVRKLKSNNVSLAKALADQRQISKTWYDEVVTVKEELHHSQESLLRCRVRENDEYDHVIQAAVERRIRNIAAPLETSVQDALDNVSSLVDNLTKVKQILSSLVAVNKEQFNCSRSSGHSRPPLGRTPKSPRKNVVHPMVDGHVLQPASIHIPRMNLEDRRRYRLQERAETREDPEMSAINEQSSVVENEPADNDSDSDTAGEPETLAVSSEDIPMEEDNISAEVSNSRLSDSISNIEEPTSIPEVIDSTINNESTETTFPTVGALHDISFPVVESTHEISALTMQSPNVELNISLINPRKTPEKQGASEIVRISLNKEKKDSSSNIKEKTPEKKTDVVPKKIKHVTMSDVISPVKKYSGEPTDQKQKNGSKEKSKIDDKEDPLEGASWMHTKRKRNSKRKKSTKDTNIRTSGMHFLLSSSDSEDDEKIEKCKPIPLRVKLVKVKGKKKDSFDSDSPSTYISTPPHLELLNNVGRRSKKQTRGSSISSNKSPKTNGKESHSEPQPVLLQSFIIRDESTDEHLLKDDSKTFTEENCGLEETLHPKTAGSMISPPKVPEITDEEGPNNVTCLLSTPMDMTECLTKEMLRNVRIFKSAVSEVNCATLEDVGDKTKSRTSNGSKLKYPSLSDEDGFKSSATSNDKKNLCPNSLTVKLTQISCNGNIETNTISKIDSDSLDCNKQVAFKEKKKSNKFFKSSGDDIAKVVIPTEKSPFDVSLMDASAVEACYFKLGKENVPPIINAKADFNSSDPNMKLKNICIVVEDIMKTPASASTSPDTKSHSQIKVSNSLFSCESKKSATINKDKRKRKTTQKESPSRKIEKQRKKFNFSEVSESPVSLPTSDDDVWTPQKKTVKKSRKTKLIIKKNTKVSPNKVQIDPISNSPSNSKKENISKNNDEIHSEKAIGTKINSNTKALVCRSISDKITNEESNIEYLSLDFMLSPPKLTSVYENVNNLIRKSIQHKSIEQDPLHIDMNDDDDDDIQVIGTKFGVDPLETCTSTRPRRGAAAKIASFKEPSLGSKLRRDSCGKKPRKKIVKKPQQISVA